MAAIVGLVALGVIVAIALLSSSRRGRAVLKVLLIVPALLLVVALLTLFSYRAGSFARHQAEARRLTRQTAVQREEARQALAEASTQLDETLAQLEEADPQVHQAMAAASERLQRALREADRPAAEVQRATAEAQRLLQDQMSRFEHPEPQTEEALAKAQAVLEQMSAQLDEIERRASAARASLPGPGPRGRSKLKGTVTCNGEVIPQGIIKLAPIEGTEGPPMTSGIVDGRYEYPHDLRPGMYRVEITALRHAGSGVLEQPLPARYNTESELTADVRPGMNVFDFALIADLDDEPATAESADAVAMAEKPEAEEAEAPKPAEKTEESAEAGAAPADVAEETTPADDRPEWVNATPRKLGSVYQMKVEVFYEEQQDFDREYAKALEKGVEAYVLEHLREPQACREIRLPLDYIQANIVKEKWEEPEPLQVRITPEGRPEEHVPMTQLYVLLEFDRAVNARIEQEWDEVVVTERLFGVGSLAGMVLMLMAGVYAYLKIDLATGGAYRARLLPLAATALALAISAGVGLALFRSAAENSGLPSDSPPAGFEAPAS